MQIKLDPKEAQDIFHTSLCNIMGTGYFNGYGLEFTWDDDVYKEARKKLQSPCLEDVILQIIKDGGTLGVIDHECDGEYNAHIDLKVLEERMELVPAKNLLNIINEEDDADDADIVLQTLFYGDVIFG
jgi:hypothetical protein